MRFGILSTAGIGRAAVIPAINDSDHEVAAIASRDIDRAEAVAAEFDIPTAYGSYEALLDDERLDAVYNPLPNSLHAEWTKRAADAGLAILCEKPLAVDADEARSMATYCADRDVTLMEAFMYRYHPRTERAHTIAREELDDIRAVEATFQFPVSDPENIRLDPDLAGGSLMDVGCYAINAARLFLGEPIRVYASLTDARNCGVETQHSGLLEYDDGVVARVSSSLDTPDTQRYRIEATNGWLEAEDAFVPRDDDGTTLRYSVDGREVVESFEPTDQYRLEVNHFADCVEQDRTPRTDATEAIRTLAVIDALKTSAEEGHPVTLS
ncbi:MAG: Gfo/Idh/MocA family oxidoreductase [Halobacteriales archaeon]|nr:Gfo/Idh/MocA family oxidoreductase [Halobacteriales archaeon]